MTEKGLWSSVLLQVVTDARIGMDKAPATKMRITQEARDWLTLPEHAAARRLICDLAGVPLTTLENYVRTHGLHRGLSFTALRRAGTGPPCLVCGRATANKARLYCSRACVGIANTGKGLSFGELGRAGTGPPCLVCGRTTANKARRYCSHTCASVAHSARAKPKPCKICGAPTGHSGRLYCGPECLRAARAAPRVYRRKIHSSL